MFFRKIYADLHKHLSDSQVTVITGMRRVGKTTAVRYLLQQVRHENVLYLDLERIEDRAIFTQTNFAEVQADLEIKGIDFTKDVVIALDEVQLVPDIVSFIKYYHDHFPVKFIVTGSSSYYLRNRFTESLAGRKRIFEIYPLDFIEYLDFIEVESGPLSANRMSPFRRSLYTSYVSHYEMYIRYGGFPEVVLTDSHEKKSALLSDILNSYIEMDVKLLANFSVIDDLYKLITLLASRIGSRMDYSKIGSQTGLNRHKVKEYIHLLEKTYFIHLVKPYSGSLDRTITVQPKVYFADMGLAQQLVSLDSGTVFENAIGLQLLRIGQVHYFQRKGGGEIDFILDKNQAFEVKETPTPADLRTLHNRAQLLGVGAMSLIGRHGPGSAFNEFIWGGTVF